MQAMVLPQLGGSVFLTDGGIETDLIFNRGIDLPEFASFVLHENAEGEAVLRDYYQEYLNIGSETGLGLVLETSTWRASKDWGSKLGYDAARLRAANERSVRFFHELCASHANGTVVLSGCIGPRGDAYSDLGPASADEAFAYHRPQVEVLAGSGVDLVSALTLTNVAEAIGFVRAVHEHSMPAVVSFTVETDGRLPSGMSLTEAITTVDGETDAAVAYFMINCAHPEHFTPVLDGRDPALDRVRGVRANASRLSHAELDESTELDDGNPDEFGAQLAALHARRPHINILGGCCGTDSRHIAAIAHAHRTP
ncbi:MAG TPA: homocysteine S-methyltransferase family protein [Acidimicrobiia bacterium]